MRERVVRAPAKVNLFLRVLEREESGYHRIETLFAGIELHDDLRLELGEGDGVRLTVEGGEDLGPPEENLAVRAARAWLRSSDSTGSRSVEIRLRKRIPAGAGLGGGSSDAAAVLRALSKEEGGPELDGGLLEVASKLGSDVPFFLSSSPLALAGGRGERLRRLEPLPSRPVVVVVPPFRIATGAAYGELDRARAEGAASVEKRASLPGAARLSTWDGVAGLAGNDFEAVVFARHPEARRIRDLLAEAGAAPALLSGSGSALFGVFEHGDVAEEAAVAAKESFPEASVYRTRTLDAWPDP